MSIALISNALQVRIDPARGGEIAGIRDLRTGTDLLMETPWAEEARRLRPVILAADAETSEDEWMRSYAGGWQTLFPSAGGGEVLNGRKQHYHGEASSVPWILAGSSTTGCVLRVDLTTMPVSITRSMSVSGSTFSMTDVITNLSETTLEYEYQSHPAFGAPFVGEGCVIEMDAHSYIPDPRFDLGEFAPGVAIAWPGPANNRISDIPGPAGRMMRFGTLTGVGRRVQLINPNLDLAATLEWDDPERDKAWLWEEVHARTDGQWDGLGYAIAVEPSTRGTASRSEVAPRLGPKVTVSFTTRLTVSPATPTANKAKEPLL